MKVVLTLFVAMVLASSTWAGITVNVYLADEKTPLLPADPNVPGVYTDIMAGTQLTIFISSDADGPWDGVLLIPWDNVDTGVLSARGYNGIPLRPNYLDSFLPAAGHFAMVTDFNFPRGLGFDCFVTDFAVPGDWFVLDYSAKDVGICEVKLYDLFVDFYNPIQCFFFTHVPSRDFDDDAIVNFTDFALLAAQWGQVAVVDPNANGSPDLNADGIVDAFDMVLFSEYWLERTGLAEPNEPNEPDADPNDAPVTDP
jgi:hypothetical protein